MKTFVSKETVGSVIEFFKSRTYKKPEQIGLFFYFKANGLNDLFYTQYDKWGNMQPKAQQENLRTLYDLAADFDAKSESGMKRTALFPFSISNVIKGNAFYNGATAFRNLGSRVSDTLDNALVSTFIKRNTAIPNELMFHDNYIELIKKDYLLENLIPIEYFAAWCMRFIGVQMPEGASKEDFRDACILYFLNKYNITEKEYCELFLFRNKAIGSSESMISGVELREGLQFEQGSEPEIVSKPTEGMTKLDKEVPEQEIESLLEKRGNETLTNDRIIEILREWDKMVMQSAADREQKNENETNGDSVVRGGINKIYYGAPGCGKSRFVSDLLKKAGVEKNHIIRVTFHPEYSNVDFIGQILPVIDKDDSGKDIVKYEFTPGSFTLALLMAYNTTDMVYLIVEEINRGNAAAIFGDMFQLLDRVKDINSIECDASEYPVNNPNMQKYLADRVKNEGIKERLQNGVYIPSNLSILATMNSSDQNVFTLDTAFKRRWSFEQVSNDIEQDTTHAYKKWFVPGTDVTWERFLTRLNDKILEYKIYSQTNEDKRLGKYFVSRNCLSENAFGGGDAAMEFAYKVLEYIWNDVCKIGREDWFDTETYRTLEELIQAFVSPKEGKKPLSVFQNISFGDEKE